MTSPRERYLDMLRAGLPKEIEEAKARHPQMEELLKFLLSHVEALGSKTDTSDKADLEVAERRLPIGLNGLWHAVDLAAKRGAKDDDEFARNIETVAMCAFVIGSRASISNNSKKFIQSKQSEEGQAANADRSELRYRAFAREIGPHLGARDKAKTTLRRIEQKKATDPEFANEIGDFSPRTLDRLIGRYRREHGN